MSEKSVVDKLRLKEGQRLFVSNSPEGLAPLFNELPGRSLAGAAGEANVALVFVRDRAELEARVPALSEALRENGALWVAYPKQSSKVPTDLNRDKISAWARTVGLDAVANFSVDEMLSAIRLKRTR